MFDYVSANEARIATALIENALNEGLTVSVYDGGEWTVKRSRDCNTILNALGTTDEDSVRFRYVDGTNVGLVSLVWGNDDDLISDYTDTDFMESLMP